MRYVSFFVSVALGLALGATAGCTDDGEKDTRSLNKVTAGRAQVPAPPAAVGDDDDDDDAEGADDDDEEGTGSGGRASPGTSSSSGTSSDVTGDDDDLNIELEPGGDPEVLADPSLTYYNFAKGVLDAKCATCHGQTLSSGASGILAFYARSGDGEGVQPRLSAIKTRVRAKTMPPSDSPQLTTLERTKLQAWVNNGGEEGNASEPGATVTKPELALRVPQATSKIYTIESSFSNTLDDATWSAYAVASASGTETAKVIVEGRAVSQPTYDWDTSLIVDGEWYVYVVVTSGNKTATSHSAGTVFVHAPGAGNKNPTIAISEEFNGLATTRQFAFPVDLTYTADDPDAADVAALAVKLEYLGPSTGLIVADAGSKSTYRWDPATKPADGVTYKLRVTVTDGRGGMAIAESRKAFGLAQTQWTYDLNLKAVLVANCSSGCHPDGLFSADSWGEAKGLGTDSIRAKTLTRVLRSPNNPMPPGLSDQDRAALQTKVQLWEWQGAREN